MDHLNSLFIDDEMTIEDKISFVRHLKNDPSTADEALLLLKQEMLLRGEVVTHIPDSTFATITRMGKNTGFCGTTQTSYNGIPGSCRRCFDSCSVVSSGHPSSKSICHLSTGCHPRRNYRQFHRLAKGSHAGRGEQRILGNCAGAAGR